MTADTTVLNTADATPQERSERSRHRSGDQLLLDAESDATPVLSVVVPTKNEEAGIAECIDGIKTALETTQLSGEIIVSDSSSDRTPAIARECGAIVVHPDEPGYGAAYRYAFEYVRGDYIVMGDADTTYDFEAIPRLLELVREEDADLAMGSRLEGEIMDGAMPPLHQYVGNPVLTRFLNLFYDADVSDAHSGFRVVTRDALDEMCLETTGMEFASEMIMEAGARDLDIAETPITYHEREGEETLDSFRDGWRHVRFMLLNAPGYLFSAPGAVLGAVGLALMSLAFFNVSLGTASFGIRTMIAGSLLVLTGVQVASFGIFSTLASDPIRRPNNVFTRLISTHLRLEQGVLVGSVIAGIGGVYAALLIGQWITRGYGVLPSLLMDIVAFTALVLGVQILFNACFMSMVASE